MKAGVLSCVSVGVAAIVAICGLNFKRQPHVTTTPFSLLVSPDLFIQTDYFQPEKWLPRIPVSTFLIRSGTDYLLVDAGNPGLPFTDDLLAAISDATKDGQLRLVLLSHCHIDHAGAIPELMRAYPGLLVVMHEQEAPYCSGGKSYAEIPSEELAYPFIFSCIGFDVSKSLPENRVLLLKGKSGDLSEARASSGKPEWQIPEGLMTFYHSPGHAPGQVAYVHVPSGSMIAGDVVEVLLDADKQPSLALSWPIFTANYTKAKESAIDLALHAASYSHVFPMHDVPGKGASKKQMLAFAKDLQKNRPRLGKGKGTYA